MSYALRHAQRALLVVAFLLPLTARAATQLLLSRDARADDDRTLYSGIVELVVNPGFDNARVTISVDGQKVVEGLLAPHMITVDFGPAAVEHKISVIAFTPDRKKVEWHETINRGHQRLRVRVRPVDLPHRKFEAVVTAPKDDPVSVVECWQGGKRILSLTGPPYHFTIPEEIPHNGFVQVTVRTQSGEEAADFWSGSALVHSESVEVRTVPLFVSVVDGSGKTRDDVDRSLFRVIDNDSEGKILEFGKAFDQPISIALLLDASASMTYEMRNATRAALDFVKHTLRPGDRCAVFSIHEVPRRELQLTSDRELVANVIGRLAASGQTAIWDAIAGGIRELKEEKNRRAIVVLTDGGDNSSLSSYDDALREARTAGIPIYVIAYGESSDDDTQEVERMNYIATETGGFVARASQESLTSRFTAIEKDLRAQYAIRYQVTGFTTPNEWRRVRVVLSSPTLTARTIRGYFAP
ncbi:MAG TPA: VWA domain-containing protein [Thermoanaerobaculia bacterium]|nr:VWA domain-containing protein [Thermoanaerobaculia bacterium]